MTLKNFQGWLVICLGIFIEALCGFGRTSCFSPFLEQLHVDLGVSLNIICGSYTCANLTAGFLLPYLGHCYDKLSAKIFSLSFVFLFGLTFILLSQISYFAWLTYPLAFFLCFSGIRTTIHAFSMLNRSMIALWFKEHRGMATGLSCLFLTLISSAIPWVVFKINQHCTWQKLWLYQGILFIVLLAPLCFFICKPKNDTLEKNGKESTTKSFLKSYTFWICLLSLAFHSLQMTGLAFHLVPVCNEVAVNADLILKSLMLISLLSITIAFISSKYLNKGNLKNLYLMFSLSNFVFLLAMLCLNCTYGKVLFVLSAGVNWGIDYTLLCLTWPQLFGTKHIGSINGWVGGFTCLGSALGPTLFSVVKTWQSYQCCFCVFLIVALLIFAGVCAAPFKNHCQD